MVMAGIDWSQVAWCRIEDRLVFLDIARDRYFRLPEPREHEFLAGLEPLGPAARYQPASLPNPADWRMPRAACPARLDGDFRLAEIARALWLQRRVEAQLAARSLGDILHDLRGLVARRMSQPGALDDSGRAVVSAFERARLLRSSATRCLSHSIALATALAARGIDSHVVVGVRSPPFGAHCWTQHRDMVLNDSLESVLRYRPILVV